ncbi:MAG: hypothetical protein K2G94_07375 [Muribaculaceae bacterium]|nr:hypothetical protein [Muribaculaceae bacterium]MDE6462192.1 hypothetical protein [Muribaculaceae bacterium]
MSTEIQEIMEKIDALTAGLAELKERVAALAADQQMAGDATPADDDDDDIDIAAAEPTDGAETDSQAESATPRRQWAFTLNDRYRFRRELFGNSDAEMIDTLELLGAMASAEEAEEYLFVDLGWNPANDDVADFLAVVRRRFSDRPANIL